MATIGNDHERSIGIPMITVTAPVSHRWLHQAVVLAWVTIVYNLAEGLLSCWFSARDHSVALGSFGLDSFIECVSGIVVLWRVHGEIDDRMALSVTRERGAALVIGLLLILLALSTTIGSIALLLGRCRPETTMPALIISLGAVAIMTWLWSSKRRTAAETGSAALTADAACSLSCIQLSAVLLIGSVVYLAFPHWWWADSAAAIGISLLILREGFETVRAASRADFSGGCCRGGCSS